MQNREPSPTAGRSVSTRPYGNSWLRLRTLNSHPESWHPTPGMCLPNRKENMPHENPHTNVTAAFLRPADKWEWSTAHRLTVG